MTRPLQPGDLCLILCPEETNQGHSLPTNQCTLMFKYAPGDEIKIKWDVFTSKEEAWQTRLITGDLAVFGTRYLVRISGDTEAETATTEEELSA